MRRLTSEEKKRILVLFKEGYSLRRKSHELRRGKSAIYYHVRKECGRKIQRRTISYRPTEDLGGFLGLFASDGCFYIGRKRYHYTLSIDLSRYQVDHARLEWATRRTHTIHLASLALARGRSFLRAVLRGLVAGDGSIYVPGHRIHIGVTSPKLVAQFSLILIRFGIIGHSHAVKHR